MDGADPVMGIQPMFEEFHIEVGVSNGAVYPITVRAPGGSLTTTFALPATDSWRTPPSAAGVVRTLGQLLFTALFTEEVRTLYEVSLRMAAEQRRPLQVRLNIQAPELARLPWEYLYDPRQREYIGLARRTPIIRTLNIPQPLAPLPLESPLRILAMLAAPNDLPALDNVHERERMTAALANLQQRGLVEVVWVEGQSWRDLQRALRRGPWHVFHFIGHGGFDDEQGEGFLVLADGAGKAAPFKASQLARLLADQAMLRLVLLNACAGATGALDDLFASTAATLIQRNLPAVLAMQSAISDAGANELAHTFYEAVADGYSLTAAVSEARIAMSLATPDGVEWGVPVLYLRGADSVLFAPQTAEDAKTPTRPGDAAPQAPEVKANGPGSGVSFEGNQAVQIDGDVITGGTVHKTSFHGPVSGTVHTGSGDLQVGDTSTSAQQRAEAAHRQTLEELLENFGRLGLIIQTIQSRSPGQFWDRRRANETELHYQDRAREEYRTYLAEISLYLRQSGFSRTVYDSFRRDLAHFANLASRVKTTYEQQQAALDALLRLEAGFHDLLRLKLDDSARTEQSRSLYRELMASAAMNFAYALAHFCLATDDPLDVQMLNASLALHNLDIALEVGPRGYAAAMKLAAHYAQEKANVLAQRPEHRAVAAQQEIERRVADPYLVLLRKAAGLPPTLTEGEVFALQQAVIDEDEREPAQLLRLAALSYLEGNGHAARMYLQTLGALETLAPLQRQFAQQSRHRLEQPDAYEGSLGVWVAEVQAGGNFAHSGIAVGDVIIALNGEPLQEPFEIAVALARPGDEPILLTMVRNQQKIICRVRPGESAGALLTQLILWHTVQL